MIVVLDFVAEAGVGMACTMDWIDLFSIQYHEIEFCSMEWDYVDVSLESTGVYTKMMNTVDNIYLADCCILTSHF